MTQNGQETLPQPRLRGFFFPFPSPGHMIPLIDIAKLLSHHGISATIVATPGNESFARPTIDRTNSSPSTAFPIQLLLLPLPPSTADLLPSPIQQNLANISLSHYPNLLYAIASLRPSLEHQLRLHRADFLVSDHVLTWAADLAVDLGIPHIILNTYGAFPLCVHESLALLNPNERFPDDDTRPICINDLPISIELTKPEIPTVFNFPQMLEWMKQAEEKSFGVLVNTFKDLEPAYVDIFRRHRSSCHVWFIGPISLVDEANNISQEDRGSRAHPHTSQLMSWLDAQPAKSVIYACFGSLDDIDAAQMREVANGLEASGHRFLWAVKDWVGAEAPSGFLPEGFEERVAGKGRVVRGWSPQVMILGHVAVGGFLTHCGWNSILEAIVAGVPLVVCPLKYEQFVNERLIIDVLRVGVRLRKRKGAAQVTAAEVVTAVGRVMSDSEEAEGLWSRVSMLAALARKAMAAGGSSYANAKRMLEELEVKCASSKKNEGNVELNVD